MSKLATAGVIVLIVVVCISLVFIAARSLGNVTFTKIIDYVNNKIVFQNNEYIYLLSNRMKKALKDYVSSR